MTTTQLTEQAKLILADYEAQSASSDAPVWLTELRDSAADHFTSNGFPTQRDEEFRFTPVTMVATGSFQPASKPDVTADLVDRFRLGYDSWTNLVFVNGFYCAELSSTVVGNGIQVSTLKDAVAEKGSLVSQYLAGSVGHNANAFAALNTMFFADGAFIAVPDGRIVESPIHIIHLACGEGGFASYPRTLLIAGQSAEVTLIESFVSVGGGGYYQAPVTEFAVGANAHVDYYRLNQEASDALHVSWVGAVQEQDSVFSATSINLGGKLTRNDTQVKLNGTGCLSNLWGLSLVDGDRLVDNHTSIDHAHPHCESHELYKAVLDDKSVSVFNGKIYVRQDAQKTDAKQTNRNLLLSRDATVHTKPQLEIFADDVKCTHGATIGQLDEQQLFYLRSRGMSPEEAQQILTYGFANDIVERIKVAQLKEYLQHIEAETLHTAEYAAGE